LLYPSLTTGVVVIRVDALAGADGVADRIRGGRDA
jgi:hypothetical protein